MREIKNIFLSGRMAVLCLLLPVVFSCKKETLYTATPKLSSLVQYLETDTTLNLLNLAMQRAGLDSAVASGGPYTLFAPSDSAFLAAGLTAAQIQAYDPQVLRGIIGYHLIQGQIGSSTLVGFVSDTVTSLNTQYSPIISQNYYGLFINGIHVTQGNIGLADGVLHKIDQIAFPPTGTLLQVLQSMPNTTMAAYIYSQSVLLNALGSRTDDLLSGRIPLDGFGVGYYQNVIHSVTLLVPTDAAFKAAGYNSISDLAALTGVDTVIRTTMVAGGILLGSLFTPDFMGGRYVGAYTYQYTPASGRPYLTSFSTSSNFQGEYNDPPPAPYTLYNFTLPATFEFGNDGISIYSNNTLTPPVLTQPNIVTSTGVIHLIDQVFVPQGTYNP